MSGWIAPARGGIKHPLNRNTFYIKTESVTGGSDSVDFYLYPYTGSDDITNIYWRFSDWAYIITYCTPWDYSLKFPVAPPTGVNMTWEIPFTTEDVKIKCNTLQVLHFIFNNSLRYDDICSNKVKGKIATRIWFSNYDTATKMFNNAGQAGK